MRKIYAALFATTFLATGARASAQAAPSPAPALSTPSPAAESTPKTLYRVPADGKWHVTLAPYVWVPSVNGSLQFTVPNVRPNHPIASTVDIHVGVGPNSYLNKLNFAIMFAAEIRQNAFAVYTDFINLNVTSDVNSISNITGPLGRVEIPITFKATTHLASTIWEIAPGYTVAHGSAGALDAFVGYRSAFVKSAIDYSVSGPIDLIPLKGSASTAQTFGDGIIGLRGQLFLSSRWYAPLYGDLGWGNGNSTWQAYGGLGYAGRTTDVVLVFRNLQYNPTAGAFQIIRFGGPALGAVLHW